MKISDIPTKFKIAFASLAGVGYIRSIPQSPTGTPGEASLEQGFPPENFSPVSAGGVPPFGQDFNGLLNQISSWNRWNAAGGSAPYDAPFASSIGGYPRGAVLPSVTGNQLWLSVVDDNLDDPDSGSSKWIPIITPTLQAPRTYYVNGATGSDSNSGLSAGSPFASIQKAIDAAQLFNLNGYTVTIIVADYLAGTYAPFVMRPINGSGRVSIVGNEATPANVHVRAASGPAADTGAPSGYLIAGLKLSSAATDVVKGQPGCGVLSNANTSVTVRNCEFGACADSHLYGVGGAIGMIGDVRISGSAKTHITASNGAFIYTSGVPFPTLNITAAVTFSSAFAVAASNAIASTYYSSISGASNVTGMRYAASSNGVINTAGSGPNYLPGTIAGTTSTGGQYT